MSEPTILNRVGMIGRTIAAIVTWIVAFGVSSARDRRQHESGS